MVFQTELLKSFEAHCLRVAVEYNGQQVTYSELQELASKITTFIINQRCDELSVIGICIEDRLAQIASIIGCINARCVFVIIDPLIPKPRLNLMIKSADIKLLITSKNNSDNYISSDLQLFSNGECYEDIISAKNEPSKLNASNFRPDDNMYLYFTSGSTGQPKGILGRNDSLLQFIKWEIDCFEINENFRCSQFISPYFDAFLRDIFVPLLVGGTICVFEINEFSTPAKISSWIDENHINLIHCVPSVFRNINNEFINKNSFQSLKFILLSGERIIPAELRPWYNIFDERIQLVNLYGATETTMIRCYYKMTPSDVNKTRIPIGKPISETQVVILDHNQVPCKKLVNGEIYIVSNYLSNGYLSIEALNSEKFVRIDIDGVEQSRAFKTGDIGRFLVDGNIDLLGRLDRQLKLLGVRIEPDEIELTLMGSGLIGNAIVCKIGEDTANEYLAAFVEKGKQDISAVSIEIGLKQWLNNNLQGIMHPSRFIVVENFPLLPNGKIDYNKLTKQIPSEKQVIAPKNSVEEKLLKIWEEILGHQEISTDIDFQKMGGNSLSLMRLIGKISKEFSVKISLAELFKNLTIQSQAGLICKAEETNLYEIKPTARKSIYHTSKAQQRVYYNFELNKERKSYNLPLAWEINNFPDLEKIEYSFRELIKRHEILRTAFKIVDGEVMQFVEDDVPFKVEKIENKQGPISQVISDFIRPFDLSKPLLFRAGLVHHHDYRIFLIVDFHHIVCDGFSQILFLSDFTKIYYGQELTPLTIQYKDYAEWEKSFRDTQEYISHREYWLNSFDENIPSITLPSLNLSKKDLEDKGGNVIFAMEKENFLSIIQTGNSQISPFSLLYSFYSVFLYRLTAEEDIVIALANSGRMQDELQELMGMFVKTLPVRFKLNPALPFLETLNQLHQVLIDANSKQLYDLSDILNDLNKSRSKPIVELFKVAFVFQNFDAKNKFIDNGDFSPIEFENDNSKYPLTLFVSENETQFIFRFEYADAYFSNADVEYLAQQFQELILKIADDPNGAITDILSDMINLIPSSQNDITFNL